MANNIEYSRLIMKRTSFTGLTPTINTGETIDNTWVDTDILPGELYYNLPDKKLYTRTGEDIILLANGTTDLTGSTTTPTLEEVLIQGNDTGTNWIEVPKPYGIKSNSTLYDDKIAFNEGAIRIQSDDLGTYSSYVEVTPDIINIFADNEMNVTGGSGLFEGIKYNADYSSNYVNRSLVDKQYVDNQITATTANILFEEGTGTLSVLRKDTSNTAGGDYSTALGFSNDVGSLGGFAVGSGNECNGYVASAIGFQNTSNQAYGFAAGYQNTIGSSYGVALGRENTAHTYSVVGGYQNITLSSYAIALGFDNEVQSSAFGGVALGTSHVVNGDRAVAVGRQNTVTGQRAFAGGYLSQATNNQAFTFGYLNDSSGQYTTTMGRENTASGTGSMAFGYLNDVNTGIYSAALGYSNEITSDYGFAAGNNHNVTGDNAAALNDTNTASGTNSLAINEDNLASGYASFVGGRSCSGTSTGSFVHSWNSSNSGYYGAILGGEGNDVSLNYSSVIGGTNNSVNSSYSSIIGGLSNSVTGTRSSVVGGQLNTNNGEDCAIIGGSGNTTSSGSIRSVIIGGSGISVDSVDTLHTPYISATNNIFAEGQIHAGTSTGNNPTANAFVYNCNDGMTQELDLQGSTATVSLTFTNPRDGATYTLVVIQGSNLDDVDLPSGYWLNDTAPFDFTTLADNDRAMVTATYLNSTWYFAVKELTYVV